MLCGLNKCFIFVMNQKTYIMLQDENEYYGDYAISTSDGHNEDWTFYWTKEDCDKDFKILMEYEDDIHVYEYSKQYGYEVIDSFWDGEL